MRERLLLDDVVCPICGSALVSIEEEARDDAVTRNAFRATDWWVRYVGAVGLAVIVCTAAYGLSLGRSGSAPLEKLGFVVSAGFALLVVGIWIRVVAAAWLRVHSTRRGRLASCHACEHRWRV